MILYNHPAEKFFGRILGNLRPAERSYPQPSPTRKSAYNEQGFFSLSKIWRYMDEESLSSQCLMCAHKTGTEK